MANDPRTIRPTDDPRPAKPNFDWAEIHQEALSGRTEVLKQARQVAKLSEAFSDGDQSTAAYRHALHLARQRAILRDVELEVSHQLAAALSDLESVYQVADTRHTAMLTAKEEFDEELLAYWSGQRRDLGVVLETLLRRLKTDIGHRAAQLEYARATLLARHGISLVLSKKGAALPAR